MYKEVLEKLLEAINAYYEQEFGNVNAFESIDDIPTIIQLAYTTSENNKHEVQSYFNLDNLQWEEYVDDKLILVDKRDSLGDFIDELNCADYDSIISDILFEANKLDGEEDEW